MSADDRIRKYWKEEPMFAASYDPDRLASLADGFERRLVRRNRIEYLCGGAVALFFALIALGVLGDDLLSRVGAALVVAGMGVVLWQLHRRASARPPDPGATPTQHHLLVSLRRQRDALASAWAWYVAPLVPGFLVMFASDWRDGVPQLAGLIGQSVAIAILIAVVLLNRFAARHLDDEHARVEAMLREDRPGNESANETPAKS